MTLTGLRLHRWPLPDPCEPGGDVGVGGIERLADLAAEIDPAIEQDIGEREALSAQEFLARHLPVEPLQAIGRDHLEAGASLGRAGDAALKKLESFAEAITVGERLADIEIDAPGPHPALGP